MAGIETPSPFMSIPSEIRVMIYELLFDDKNNKVFEIRSQNPDVYANRANHPLRSSYAIDHSLMRQRALTTYQLCTDVEMHTSIMSVNRKIYGETTHLLYGNRTFSFYKDIEAIVPFFSDLTPGTRFLVQDISLFKQGFVFCRESNRCEWSNLCEFLRDQMQLRGLRLIVEGGRPRIGWDESMQYTSAEFKTLSSVAYEPLEWALQLLEIKGIQKLDITSEIHTIPPPSHSPSMAFFGAFSASIDNGFAEYLRQELIGV
ncbi:hypothetical protein SBOR_3162 [Sclerotinia borealis F-4128]|uniref:Uncharacterized protein n=1 Tax=Sclerotinia borealis (strain F-4128) TaxID=1432307 RepID=W9CPL5_SCLBF|nr:hypothetical protein SBOR_3162 [Sclerotinia borealis F-4128]